MPSLLLHRLHHKLLQWSGKADARATEFAHTVLTTGRPDAAGAQATPDGAPAGLVQHIGRYLIKGRLGAGGLGEVFEAWDPLLSRPLAVKTLRLQMEPELRALLDDHILNEARAAARLNHPNIVTVFDAGLCTPGVYIAMEMLQGRDLRQAMAQGWRPTPLQAAHVAQRVAEALAYAHDKGVVHCDIKPANIFLDAEDRPKVLDFGIARLAHDKQLPRSEDPLFGSPHYLAPEQLQHGVADARTDVRALGVVLYEMLTARKAFAGDTVDQVINAVLLNHPAPAHELRSGVPRSLSLIAARAMARDPAERYESADEMAHDLRVWCERSPMPTATDSARRPAARRKTPVAWTLAGVLLCMLTAGWLWWLSSAQAPAAQAQSAKPPAASAAVPEAPTGVRPAAPAQTAGAPSATVAAVTAVAAAEGRAGRDNPVAATRKNPPKNEGQKPAAASRKAATPVADGGGAVLLSISPWGEVEVNGKPAGTTPPLSRLSLPAGRHTITVRNEDFPSYTTTVVVQADKPAMVRHRFVQ